jgi:hypothetical protein
LVRFVSERGAALIALVKFFFIYGPIFADGFSAAPVSRKKVKRRRVAH